MNFVYSGMEKIKTLKFVLKKNKNQQVQNS